jgi:hypothetical protein
MWYMNSNYWNVNIEAFEWECPQSRLLWRCGLSNVLFWSLNSLCFMYSLPLQIVLACNKRLWRYSYVVCFPIDLWWGCMCTWCEWNLFQELGLDSGSSWALTTYQTCCSQKDFIAAPSQEIVPDIFCTFNVYEPFH